MRNEVMSKMNPWDRVVSLRKEIWEGCSSTLGTSFAIALEQAAVGAGP